jgi:transposase
MPYSSSLTDREWEILEPLLTEILPPKKRTRPANWSKREILDGLFYQLKNGCNWEDLPPDLPPYSTVYWHYKQWREAGSIEKLMDVLHGQVREGVKKTPNGQRPSLSTHKRCKTLAMRVWSQKGSAFTRLPMASNAI